MRTSIRAMNALLALFLGIYVIRDAVPPFSPSNLPEIAGAFVGLLLVLAPYYLTWQSMGTAPSAAQMTAAKWANIAMIVIFLLVGVVSVLLLDQPILDKPIGIGLRELLVILFLFAPFALNLWAIKRVRQQLRPAESAGGDDKT